MITNYHFSKKKTKKLRLEYWKEIGQLLKVKRLEASFTQRQVADLITIKDSQEICNIELGACAPPLNIMKNMISLYKMPKDEIVDVMVKWNTIFLESELD